MCQIDAIQTPFTIIIIMIIVVVVVAVVVVNCLTRLPLACRLQLL